MNNEKFLKILKVFSVLLLLYSILPILTLLSFGLNPEVVQRLNISLDEAIPEQIAILLYCVIGGIGILLKKRWALYLVAIPGIISLFFVCLGFITYVIALQTGEAYAPNFITLFLRIFLGIFSVIIYRKRESLNKKFL